MKSDTLKAALIRAAVEQVKKTNPTPGLFAELELRQARAVVDAFLDQVIERTVKGGQRTRLPGFGTFAMSYRAGNTKRPEGYRFLSFSAAGAHRGLPKKAKAVSP